MKRFFQSEIGAALLWLIASLILAALVFPWIYTAGKQLAEAAKTSDLPSLLESIGRSCDRAQVGRYFNRTLLLCALCSFPFLIKRIRRIRKTNASEIIEPQNQISALSKLTQLTSAFIISGGILWLTGTLLMHLGAFTPDLNPPGFSTIFSKALMPAIGASVVEEWIFRGLLLGLWLRVARPLQACIGSSLLFAFLHFLQPPSDIGDPTQVFAGFILLGKTLLHFTDPQFFVTDFITLISIGLILAWARIKTGRLWFCFGLHAGWVFTFKLFGLLHDRVPDHMLYPWGVGRNLRSGIIPLIALVITAVVCHFIMKRFFSGKQPTTPSILLNSKDSRGSVSL